MTETPAIRRKRLTMRAWRRGMREMDLILGPFADARLATLPAALVDQFEALLSAGDPDLYRWVTGAEDGPPEIAQILGQIRDHHAAP